LLVVGDDWAEDHHDVELVDEAGRRLAKTRLPEGMVGITRLHELLAAHVPEDAEPAQVVIGIETDRGPWVGALLAAGYQVYAINPMQVARYRERHSTSGAKSDAGDAHVLAELVRLDRAAHRPIAGDSDLAEAIKLLARAHQTLIWDRHRQLLRLRGALWESFPAALAAVDDLAAPDALELLAAAPDPASAARLSQARIRGALTRARRRNPDQRAAQVQAALGAPQLGQPPMAGGAYAAIVGSLTAVITALNTQIQVMEAQVVAHFGRHPDAERYRSQPGLGTCSPPGCWPSSATTPPATPAPGPARTTPGPARSPKPAARSGSCRPATPATTGWPTPYTSRRSAPDRLTRRPRLLRHPAGPRHRPPRRAAPARQPAGRHPPRLPEDRHDLQRADRLGPPPHPPPARRSLTLSPHGMSDPGMLSGVRQTGTRPSTSPGPSRRVVASAPSCV
jgi:transposase